MAAKVVSLSMLQRKHQSLKLSTKMNEGKEYALYQPYWPLQLKHLLQSAIEDCVV